MTSPTVGSRRLEPPPLRADAGRPPNRAEADLPWWRRWLLHGLPETIGLVLALAAGGPPPLALAWALLLRFAWVTGEVLHGTGHTLARLLVDRDPAALRLDNLLEHRSPRRIAGTLLPLAAIGPAGTGPLPPAWLDAGDAAPARLRLKAGAGILLHIAVILLAAMALGGIEATSYPRQALRDLLTALIAANAGLVMASRSDLLTLLSGRGRRLYCGNFGFIAAPESPPRGELLSARAIERFARMGRETELRGAQAGGGLVMTRDRLGQDCFVGHKIVNAKRGDLTTALEAGFRRRRRRAHRAGCRPHPAGLLASWHYRFGTSGPPAVRETHWLEWTPARRRRLWRLEEGRWRSQRRVVHHRITHNGDFEAFHVGGAELDVISALGPWLERALRRSATAVVDSARIAGLMDLLICQGDWFAAVRWGFLSTLAPAAGIPPEPALEAWSERFEAAFTLEAGPDAASPGSGWPDRLAERVLPGLRQDPRLASHGDRALRHWVEAAVDAFLHHDPGRAVVTFMERARGSFGLVVVSTTWPDRLVLSSLGQPITIGADPASGLSLYASEAAAVDAVLAGREGSWRLDLDQNAGEIAVLSSDDLRITSLSLERQLSAEELQRRRHPYGVSRGAGGRPGPFPPPPLQGGDPVAADLAGIPSLLGAIRNDWSNPGSCNRQSADALAQLLIAKAANVAEKERLLRQAGLAGSLAKSRHIDLLVTGVENSLWLGEQFARDLSILMPRLTVRALSANAVLKALQHDIESLALARQSIVLVLSHSGRTFPSLQVMEACDLLVRRGVIREFFLLIGEPESLLGSPILEPRHPGEPFSRRLLTTGAGRRRAEPATATVAAMHQTLTELMFSLSRQLLQAFPDERLRPLGMRLGRDELMLLENMENNYFLQESSEILGVDGHGRRRGTSTSRRLERAGRRWGLHVMETPIAWAIHALYILISVGFGLPPVQTLLGAAPLLHGGAVAADIGIYIFGPWFWTLALRRAQGRPLLARTGRRSLVIGEAAWIHPLLTNYVSKLFSLSFGIATLDVQGADPADHLLHTHAHRLVRGTLLFLGIPDGRCSALQRAEAQAVLLAARQSDGIRHWGTGPEIVAVGTDPAIAAGPFRTALVLPSHIHDGCGEARLPPGSNLSEAIRESRFGTLRRLLGSYVFFWAMARQVARLPLLHFKWWRSQSRTRVMTTAAPVSAARLDIAEPREIAELALDSVARREQS